MQLFVGVLAGRAAPFGDEAHAHDAPRRSPVHSHRCTGDHHEEFWHMLVRGMLSNDLELAMHSLEFRQTGAMCNVEEVGQILASGSPCQSIY